METVERARQKGDEADGPVDLKELKPDRYGVYWVKEILISGENGLYLLMHVPTYVGDPKGQPDNIVT